MAESDAPSSPPRLKFAPLPRVKKTGDEKFRTETEPLPLKLLDFWQWSVSDLVSNATRGRLAEFIVASAAGVDLKGIRDEWSAFDLITPWGLKIEVKSAAYIQSWAQRDYSKISFNTPKTRAWDPVTSMQSQESLRQADCYVFALLVHLDRETVDPLNLDQWRFFVLPTSVLDQRTRSQSSITLKSLKALCGEGVAYYDLRAQLKAIPVRTGSTQGSIVPEYTRK